MKKICICIAIVFVFTNQVFAEINAANKQGNVVFSEKQERSEQANESTLHHFKNGMNSCILSLIYSPIKVNIAIIGGVVGGVAYPFSGFNSKVSKKIWSSTMGGTYLITEDILTGKKKPELFLKSKTQNQ